MDLPVGALAPERSVSSPTGATLPGQYTHLQPLHIHHAPGLFKHLGGSENQWRWTYLLIDGFPTPEDAVTEIEKMLDTPGLWFYAVMSGPQSDPAAEPVGIIAYLNEALAHRRIEVGSVLFSGALQRTRASTEANMLMVQHAFEDLGCHRVEWKANSLNSPSQTAAKRLGYTFEGIFRKHMIFKGRFRDSAYFAMVDDDWPVTKKGFQLWLAEENFDEQGKQRKGLVECREVAAQQVNNQ